jgi:hypothetical protein
MSRFIVTVEPRFDGAHGCLDAPVALGCVIDAPVALACTVDISYDDRTLPSQAPVALGCGDPAVHEIDSGARLSPEGA